jgi:outer membrane protein OmpA-like peptidoglycan-associated protein
VICDNYGNNQETTCMRIFFLFCILFTGRLIFGQQLDSTHADCDKALSIPIYKNHHHAAPRGGGSVLEFQKNGMHNPRYFDKEHNTIWYTFTIPNDGILTFDIIPDSIKDDYDFILFRQSGKGTCDSIKNKTLQPVRSNISHNSKQSKSLTGLSAKGHYEFNQPGVREYYSSPLPVKEGEKYILVLDNVYENGYGHTLKFYFKFKLGGIVLDSLTNKPLTATVILTDLKANKEIARTTSDSLNRGLFQVPVSLADTMRWSVNIGASGYFNENLMVTQNSIGSLLQRPRIFKLRKIIKDKSFALKDINFFPNKDILKPGSLPALQNLLQVMRDNSTLKIRIEGHTNFDPSVTKDWDVKLSQLRAEAVAKFLTDNGVDQARIKTTGYGSTRMIFPNPRTQEEQQANMRVEVKIIEF